MSELAVSHASLRTARREREREHRYRDALAGATKIFAAKGFHDAQMKEIAAAAELSLASFYSMFEGKEAIYRAVMKSAAERLLVEVQARVDRYEDPVDRVHELIAALFDYFERNRAVLRILLSGTRGLPWTVRERMGPTSKVALDEFYAWVIDLSREVDRPPKLDPETLSAALVGTVTYLAAYALEEHPDESISDLAAQVQAIFAPTVGPGSRHR